MPIRPENRAPDWLSEPLADFLTAEEQHAASVMTTSFGVDVTRTYQFWESMVGRITSGTLTDHKCAWDIELPYTDDPIRIEVKYAQESWCRFSRETRPIFKFAAPKGRTTEKAADVIVLIGIDALEHVHAWAVPAREVRKCASITLTSPRYRLGGQSRSRGVDSFHCPPSQLLPEVLRSYRHHRETAAATRLAAIEATGQTALDVA
jgi:hypothetical protein